MRTTKKLNTEILASYGWNPETLKADCLSAARQIVNGPIEDMEGNISFSLDPYCENDGRAEAAAVFLDTDQRTTEQLLSDFFGVEAENPEYIEEEIEDHADRMSDALRSLILPEIENQFPGPDWSVYVGFGEGILGVFVQAEQ